MKSPWVVLFLAPGLPFSMLGQQGKTPQAALEEIANADKPELIERHLPGPVQKSIDELPKLQKRQVLDTLLSMKSEQLDRCIVKPAGDADGWDIVDENGENTGRIRLTNVFQSGLDALLTLEVQAGSGPQVFIVAMHLDGDDWRLDNFGPWQKTDLRLRQLVHQPTQLEKNETAAQETLRFLWGTLSRYAAQYPISGYPSRLTALIGRTGQEASVDHAGFLDESYAAEPLVMNAYEFHYSLTRTGGAPLYPDAPALPMRDRGAFEIVAMPIEYGKSGTRSYFINENGRITATTENRPATATDPAVDDDDD